MMLSLVTQYTDHWMGEIRWNAAWAAWIANAADVLSPAENKNAVQTLEATLDRDDIQASLNGDEQAYARLVRRYEQMIGSQMWKFTRDPNEQRELVQDVFVEAYRSLAGYRGKAPFLHWLRRIATRTGYRFWKRKTRERERHADMQEIENFAAADPKDSEPSEAAEMLYKLLATLSTDDRLVLTLHYLEGCDMNEVAERTGWTRTYCKVRAFRARQKLKTKLERAGYGSGNHA